jgi:hypothetical protein
VRQAIVVAAVALLIAAGCSDDDATREGGEITEPGPISVFELRPGDCIYPDDDLSGELENIEAVPCADPHTHEVFAVPEYEDVEGVYPGEAALQEFADAACLEAFEEYTGTDYLDSELFFTYLHPSVESWNDDDRGIICVLTDKGAEMVGSKRAATTTTDRDGGKTTTTTTAP